ncbi:hypothetical protein HD554DRAFT_2079164 [Boletus coccyginus]|nr:hypothetical protein HD554DRAFT_2079164 [Boletus coccyginus]
MILRVYAMWNQSKKILVFLLFIYTPEIVFSIVWECIYNNTNGAVSVSESQFYNYKSCDYSLKASPPQADRAIPRFVLGVALLILSLIPTLKHMVEMYKFTKEGAVYFVVYVQLVPLRHFCTMSIMIVRLCLRLKDHNTNQGIDTGFGVFSTQIANGNKALSAMHFADVVTEQNQTLDYDAGDSRAIRLDALGDRVHQV